MQLAVVAALAVVAVVAAVVVAPAAVAVVAVVVVAPAAVAVVAAVVVAPAAVAVVAAVVVAPAAVAVVAAVVVAPAAVAAAVAAAPGAVNRQPDRPAHLVGVVLRDAALAALAQSSWAPLWPGAVPKAVMAVAAEYRQALAAVWLASDAATQLAALSTAAAVAVTVRRMGRPVPRAAEWFPIGHARFCQAAAAQ